MPAATHSPDEIADANDVVHVGAVLLGAAVAFAPEAFTKATRGAPVHAFARQILFYLVNTAFDVPEDVVARVFARDVTTVRHGIALIEEMREAPEFDALIDDFERVFVGVVGFRRAFARSGDAPLSRRRRSASSSTYLGARR